MEHILIIDDDKRIVYLDEKMCREGRMVCYGRT